MPAATTTALRAYSEGCGIGGDLVEATRQFHADDAEILAVHPFNSLHGTDAYIATVIKPLQSSLDHLHRRDTIAFAGEYQGADWVTCMGDYTGHFARDWLGIPATDTMVHLRYGEFHRMEAGRACESYLFFDIPALMIAAGVWPIQSSPGRKRGTTGPVPGPATGDGLQWHATNPERSRTSLAMVTAMLRSLATPDEAWRCYWHRDMAWFGPAAFGAFVGIDEFAGFQVPFERAFKEWSGGAANNGMTTHVCRFADGDFICTAGWPSLTGIHVRPFLDMPASHRRVFMRVCDWWRRQGSCLVENWVFVDVLDVLVQLGRDVLAELQPACGARA